MTRRNSLGLMLLTALTTVLMVFSPSAYALELPQSLPTSTGTRSWTGSAGEFFVNVETATILCEKATSEGTEEPGGNPPKGLFHIQFKGCKDKQEGVTCTGLGEEAGIILLLGKWHLVWDRQKGGTFSELTTALLYLFETLHFNCTALLLFELKGEALCLHLSPTEKNVIHSDHCIAEGIKPTEEWCKKDALGACVEPVVPRLEVSDNHGAVKEAALLALESRTYGVELFADV